MSDVDDRDGSEEKDVSDREDELGADYNGAGSRSASRSRSRSKSRSRSRSRSHSASRSRSRSRSGSHYSRGQSRSRSRSRSRRRRRSPSRSRSRSRSHTRKKRKSRSHSHSPYHYRHKRSRSVSPLSSRKRHVGSRDNPETSNCLGIFGLSLYTTERDLRQYFEKYGSVESIQIVYDRQTGRSRGFGFVYYESSDDAREAKQSTNGLEIDSRRIRVDYSITKRAHTPTPGVYMGKATQHRNYRKSTYDDYSRDREYYSRDSHRHRDYYSSGGYRSRSNSPRELINTSSRSVARRKKIR
ncbi:transformer-2 protein homolog beta-like isoform X2 [Stylophora pistillata]|uniref:transformer-2 protein homolog beta-like isoform X2 n=1 Tax=Stylophora pistillata TaxID=50429 RepID=UPI000C040576|nr:transformer-2 protein homolog beta-like isoform X2 [Stylophora pistillata]